MRAMIILCLGLLCWAAAPHAAIAQQAPEAVNQVSPADEAEFQRVIAAQIEALRTKDGPAAFAFASPGIQAKFGNPATFLSMVEGGYAALMDPRSVTYAGVTDALGYPTQVATIIDRQGRAWTALYAFERQSDGAWRISGCVLKRLDEIS